MVAMNRTIQSSERANKNLKRWIWGWERGNYGTLRVTIAREPSAAQSRGFESRMNVTTWIVGCMIAPPTLAYCQLAPPLLHFSAPFGGASGANFARFAAVQLLSAGLTWSPWSSRGRDGSNHARFGKGVSREAE